MLVKLTDHVLEGNNVKTSIRTNRGQVIPWVKDAVIEMSDTSAKKYVKAGKARYLEDEEQAAELERMAKEASIRDESDKLKKDNTTDDKVKKEDQKPEDRKPNPEVR